MNEMLEGKLFVTRIKTQLLDLTGELIADDLTDKHYAINRILNIIEYIEKQDVPIPEILNSLAIKSRLK
jgi:Leucine-rich repeat (LRR) protein